MASLVALGASSGLVPCPSAIAILLGAIALHRYAFGLLLVLVFSVGVASTLTAVGLLVLASRAALLRVPGTAPLARWLPVVSSACVTAVGVLLCASAWSASR
jgi:ABC-type nickel/cobalt efflux system permease component RcnA